MTEHQAAWLTRRFAPLEVGEAPISLPAAGQISVRNRAVAINPIDRYKQQAGDLMYGWIRYPFVLGNDLAGEVVAVGPGVTRFQVGDRVVGHATGMEKARNAPAEGAFQSHTLVLEQMASPIPDSMPYTQAAVLPLGLSTAACGLFAADQLALELPSHEPTARDETVVIWGGSTSVGCNAIQLAVAAGYRVLTTASPHNQDRVRELGATEVFDHHSPTVVADVRRSLAGRPLAGAMAIGDGSAAACIDVVAGSEHGRRVAIVTFPLRLDEMPPRPGYLTALTWMVPRMLAGLLGLWWRARRQRVQTTVVWGTALMDTDLSRVIYERYLPQALETGQHVPAPNAKVVGEGLGAIQAAFETHRAGVSAAKVVVAL